MSNHYVKTYGYSEDGLPISKEEMRKYCNRPGRIDKNGKILYTTEQAHKDECDVNNIIRKYDKTGVLQHVTNFEAQYGDMTGTDFKTAQDLIIGANNQFNKLPAEIRKRFKNDPQNLLTFMEKSENREEAITLGLISKTWAEELDGMGEHVTKIQAKERDEKEKVKKSE